MSFWLFKTCQLSKDQVSLNCGQLPESLLFGLFILGRILFFEGVVLEDTLLDKATVAEELDELAGLEPVRVHGVAEAAVIAENTIDDLPLLLLQTHQQKLSCHFLNR